MGKKKKIGKIKKKVKIKKIKKRKGKFLDNANKTNIYKTGEDKVKIKKITKQPTEKKIYNIKDYVVYPKHGVGKIISVDKAGL